MTTDYNGDWQEPDDENGDWIEPDPEAPHPLPPPAEDDEAEELYRRSHLAVDVDEDEDEDVTPNVVELPPDVTSGAEGIAYQCRRVLDIWRSGGCAGPAPWISVHGVSAPAAGLLLDAEAVPEFIAEVRSAGIAAYEMRVDPFDAIPAPAT